MSMENAILEHAAALRELSAAIKTMYAGRADALALPADQGGTPAAQCAAVAVSPAAKEAVSKAADAELEQAVQKVEADAKAESKPEEVVDAAKEVTGDEQAAELDYVKDVRPGLLAAIKTHGKEKVAAVVKSFGVERADQVPAEKLADLLAQVAKLAA